MPNELRHEDAGLQLRDQLCGNATCEEDAPGGQRKGAEVFCHPCVASEPEVERATTKIIGLRPGGDQRRLLERIRLQNTGLGDAARLGGWIEIGECAISVDQAGTADNFLPIGRVFFARLR